MTRKARLPKSRKSAKLSRLKSFVIRNPEFVSGVATYGAVSAGALAAFAVCPACAPELVAGLSVGGLSAGVLCARCKQKRLKHASARK